MPRRPQQPPRLLLIPRRNQQVFAIKGADHKHADALGGQRLDQRVHDAGRLKVERPHGAQADPVALGADIAGHALLQADHAQLIAGAHQGAQARAVGPGGEGGIGRQLGHGVAAGHGAQLQRQGSGHRGKSLKKRGNEGGRWR